MTSPDFGNHNRRLADLERTQARRDQQQAQVDEDEFTSLFPPTDASAPPDDLGLDDAAFRALFGPGFGPI
ncbi:hypothetical protein [Actinoplanes sp. NPDC026670]|uniref:hypothetical protein n=1 Tax=Actinoplanes sp. NPDC026670 TaxID=3154700 RepID=UPI0033D46087